MPAATFESLPNEILCNICQQLYKTYRWSVLDFSSVSWRCRQTALPLLFETVQFTVAGAIYLQKDVERYRELLEKSGAAQYVRYLVISGTGEVGRHAAGGPVSAEIHRQDVWLRPVIFLQTPDPRSGKEDFAAISDYSRGPFHSDIEENNLVYQPLADLIVQLPNLTDVLYECNVLLPSVIFRSLEENHPACRLHHHSFYLHANKLHYGDFYQIDLLTSPLLYSIRPVCYFDEPEEDEYDIPDFTTTYIQNLVAGAAPNLQRVMLATAGVPTAKYETLSAEIRQAFEKAMRKPSKPGLEALELYICRDWDSWNLGYWKRFTDLSCLKSLKLYGDIYGDCIEDLTLNFQFPELEAFSLTLDVDPRPEDRQSEFWGRVEALLLSLPPLIALGLSGVLLPLDHVLEYHGPCLKTLNVTSEHANGLVLSHKDAAILRKLCPHLEHLQVMTKRSQGDSFEVEIYRELGKLSKLRRLNLSLDCSPSPVMIEPGIGTQVQDQWNWPPQRMFTGSSTAFQGVQADVDAVSRSQITKHEMQISLGDEPYVRQVFINCALDGDLARSIFLTIASATASDSSLQTMHISTRSHGIQPRDLVSICKRMNCVLDVERNYRGQKNALLVTERSEMSRKENRKAPTWNAV